MKNYIPFDATVLPFTRLTSEQFEQYCEWLLIKDKNLKNVHRIKGNGHYQGGLDICANFVKSPRMLAVYECKCWGNLSIQELEKTIQKFKQNDLHPKINMSLSLHKKKYLEIFRRNGMRYTKNYML